MDDLSFLESFGGLDDGNATLKAVLHDGQVCHISDHISPYRFIDYCPLLYHAFEYGFMGRSRASIDAPSMSAAISLVRFCYTGNYLPPCADDAPDLLLYHAETYKIAEDLDVVELQLLAHGNFTCQLDIACCQPTPPRDLLETIRFIYKHFSNTQSRLQHGLVSTLCNYCISIFLYHKLGEEPEFLKVVREIPAFCQDLCQTNMERNFEDDCALDIIRLSLDPMAIQPSARPRALASRDIQDEMMHDVSTNTSPKRQEDDDLANAIEAAIDEIYSASPNTASDDPPQDNSSMSTTISLVHRPRASGQAGNKGFETDSSSDEDGFSLVRRPRIQATTMPDDVMSSPGLLPAGPIDVLAATGSDYPSDDDWSLVQ